MSAPLILLSRARPPERLRIAGRRGQRSSEGTQGNRSCARSWFPTFSRSMMLSATKLPAMIVGLGVLARDPCEARPPADVDGARIAAADRDPGNWMTHGRTYRGRALQPARGDQRSQRRQARPRLVFRGRQPHRHGGHTAGCRRHHVYDQRVEYRARARCEDRPRTLALRPAGATRVDALHVLRAGESRRRGLEGQGLRRDDRRTPDRDRRRERAAALAGADDRSQSAVLDHRALRAS